MINILSSYVADKIAAGEVIERPLSIMKELVENSIDAGATRISIEIKNGGKSYIRVTDNGCGIKSNELEIAFLRHATGKISTLDDLDNITTLGFRGEALASISAISILTIISRTKDEQIGTKLVMHGGKTVSKEQIGSNVGTTVIVEDVFYNTPARRKFMGSDAREASSIIELLQKLAIYYSDIKFSVYNNGNLVINTQGDGNYQNTIKSIYKEKDFSNLIEIKGDGVLGFISDPSITKTSRRGQIYFVNGRIVSSKDIQVAVEKGYGDRVFSGYPIAVLFIDVDPSEIDVNIHPGKREVKFLYPDQVQKSIINAIEASMKKEASIPSADYSYEFINKMDPFAEKFQDILKESKETKAEKPAYVSASTSDSASSQASASAKKPASEEKNITFEAKEPQKEIVKEEPAQDKKIGIREYLARLSENENKAKEEEISKDQSQDEIKIEPKKNPDFDFEKLRVCGYIFNLYILAEHESTVYIIDQHAAHERIFYEKLVGEYNSSASTSQPILTSIVVETSMDVYNMDRDWLKYLFKLGYKIDDFGIGTFIVREIPSFMEVSEAQNFLNSFIDNLSEQGDFNANNIVIDKLIMKSCKSAVKANDRLSLTEINDLLKNLSKCNNPFSCPHGRPVLIKVTKDYIEKAFKRK